MIDRTDRTSIARMVRKAVARVLEVLKEIEEKIPNDRNLKNVIKALDYMITTNTGSGVEKYLGSWSVPGGDLSQLDKRHCDFAMRLFNGLVPTDAQINELKPILAPVLEATFQGSLSVIQYLKDIGMRLVLPRSLRGDWSRKIYLRDCASKE